MSSPFQDPSPADANTQHTQVSHHGRALTAGSRCQRACDPCALLPVVRPSEMDRENVSIELCQEHSASLPRLSQSEWRTELL